MYCWNWLGGVRGQESVCSENWFLVEVSMAGEMEIDFDQAVSRIVRSMEASIMLKGWEMKSRSVEVCACLSSEGI